MTLKFKRELLVINPYKNKTTQRLVINTMNEPNIKTRIVLGSDGTAVPPPIESPKTHKHACTNSGIQ